MNCHLSDGEMTLKVLIMLQKIRVTLSDNAVKIHELVNLRRNLEKNCLLNITRMLITN